MFGLEWITAIIKIFFNIAFAVITAIVLRPAWNCVATNYLYEWLPERFLVIPYWHVVAFILVCTFLGELFPKIVNIENNTNVD